ncbi:hypothetical protein HUJ04_003861 [Dendroctonus ponderosae]|nr:hypothetical protein HUJ04_003861 [Dendroctonus ponderosae]
MENGGASLQKAGGTMQLSIFYLLHCQSTLLLHGKIEENRDYRTIHRYRGLQIRVSISLRAIRNLARLGRNPSWTRDTNNFCGQPDSRKTKPEDVHIDAHRWNLIETQCETDGIGLTVLPNCNHRGLEMRSNRIKKLFYLDKL